MGGTIISWNATNWITIFLMAFLGFLVLGAVTKMVKGSTAAA